MATLAADFPKEQKRVRELLEQYKEISAPGAMGVTMIENVLEEAEIAVSSQDVVRMLKAYSMLKEMV